MAGTDTVRGIHYQAIRSVVTALDCLDDPDFTAIRVEGAEDLYDLEVFGKDGVLLLVQQIKTRGADYAWTKADVRCLLSRWADLKPHSQTRFEFVTNGRIGARLAGTLPTETPHDAIEEGLGLAVVVAEDAPLAEFGRRARLVVDSATDDGLFARAVAKVRSRLVSIRGDRDADEQATALVDAFYRTVLTRASEHFAANRLFSREEIAGLLQIDVSPNLGPAWVDTVRAEYLSCVSIEPIDPAIVAPRFERRDSVRGAMGDDALLSVTDLVGRSFPTIIFSPTGSGKSTAAVWLRTAAASALNTVVVVRAEEYRAGRLAVLVRAELERRLGRQISMQAARAILDDPQVTLIVDGASEVSRETRNALAEDLASIVLDSSRRPSLVLLGRNLAPMRGMLPSTVEAEIVGLSGLSPSEQETIANAVLAHERDTPGTVAEIRRKLGGGSDVPLLFRLALDERNFSGAFASRSELYDHLFERMFGRVGAEDYALTLASAGCAFASLLNEGTRATDSLRWNAELRKAVFRLSPDDKERALDDVRRAIRRSGLVTEVGFDQVLVPTHDSFADFLAGRAHAMGAVEWPPILQEQDEERLRFAGELQGLQTALVLQIAADVPELIPRLASVQFVSSCLPDPTVVADVLSVLVGELHQVGIFKDSVGRVWSVPVVNGPSRELQEADGIAELRRLGGVQLEGGLISWVATLWQSWLRRQFIPLLQTPPDRGTAQDHESIVHDLEKHSLEAAREVERIVSAVLPAHFRLVVLSAMGQLGLDMVVAHDPSSDFSAWPMTYRASDQTTARFEELERFDKSPENCGRTDALTRLRDSATATAAKLVKEAINDATVTYWL